MPEKGPYGNPADTRHWLAHWDHDTGPAVSPVIVRREGQVREYRADGWRVEGPYVDASTYQGAVEAIRQRLDEMEAEYQTGARDEDYMRAIIEIRTVLGGQSE